MGVVDDIIVDEGSQMDQLPGHRGIHHCFFRQGVEGCGDNGQDRSQALASPIEETPGQPRGQMGSRDLLP